jgi:predicted glycoside hydrolase/deacetylase ChbG (UPF0249 family)
VSNPTLERLDLEPDDRVVIVHADDIGMCHAANVAFWEVQSFGIVTCGSVMMPCPWVPEMAAWCRAHPEADVGVHITLTSEWDGYRWRPLSTADPRSGLIDGEGYMWRSIPELFRHMDVDAAIAEMRAQIELALRLGIDVTHIDTHMGSAQHPQLAAAYIQLAVEYRVPAMLPRLTEEQLLVWGLTAERAGALLSMIDNLAATGFPVLDGLCSPGGQGDPLEVYRRAFDSVPVGITHLLLHPSVSGYDIEAITKSAPSRIADYETFMRPELMEHVAGAGIHLIGYRRLRDLLA